MSNKTKADLITEINVIKNETVKGANTANRIGTMLTDMVDSVANTGSVTGMDLDNDNFTIEFAGNYYVSSYPSNSIYFPMGSTFDGCKITIVNPTSEQVNIQGDIRPKTLDNVNINLLPSYSCSVFISINDKWYLINQFTA